MTYPGVTEALRVLGVTHTRALGCLAHVQFGRHVLRSPSGHVLGEFSAVEAQRAIADGSLIEAVANAEGWA